MTACRPRTSGGHITIRTCRPCWTRKSEICMSNSMQGCMPNSMQMGQICMPNSIQIAPKPCMPNSMRSIETLPREKRYGENRQGAGEEATATTALEPSLDEAMMTDTPWIRTARRGPRESGRCPTSDGHRNRGPGSSHPASARQPQPSSGRTGTWPRPSAKVRAKCSRVISGRPPERIAERENRRLRRASGGSSTIRVRFKKEE